MIEGNKSKENLISDNEQNSNTSSVIELKTISKSEPIQRRQTESFKTKICIHSKVDPKDLEIIKQIKTYQNNSVSTTKYNVFTWLPKSLFVQFFRFANVYFLIISLLSFFPFSPKEPISTSGTLLFVILVSMVKEAYEDCKRYKSDSELNNKECLVFKDGKWTVTNWGKLRIGDIVQIKRDETIPADILILETSNETGLCFVDTKNLDGETNLKEKFIHKGIKDKIITNYSIKGFYEDYNSSYYSKFDSRIICDKPNEYLDSWEGTIFINSIDNFQASTNIKNLLLRGSDLKNTEFIIGIIVYAGHLTKIMRNAKNPPIKSSNIMVIMNKILLSLFVGHFIIVIIFTGFNVTFSLKNNQYLSSYIKGLEVNKINYRQPLTKFITFYVAYSSVIPISLYVGIEVIKLFQNLFVQNDVNMYHENKSAVCKTADLIEELGQVDFIFSDKTGTLTMNEMAFKFCAINGKVYGKKVDESIKTTSFSKNEESKLNDFNINGDFEASKILKYKHEEWENIENYFRVLAVCHSCISERDPLTNELKYASSSPDELALVKGASEMGLVFVEKTTKYISFENRYLNSDDPNFTEKWEVLAEIPFDSDRKRMSLIVKDSKTQDTYVFTKGADNIMLPRCKLSSNEKEFYESLFFI